MAGPSLHADGMEMEGMKIKGTWVQKERWRCSAAEDTIQETPLISLSVSDASEPETACRRSRLQRFFSFMHPVCVATVVV